MRLEPILPILCLVGIRLILCFVATVFSLASVFYVNVLPINFSLVQILHVLTQEKNVQV